MQFIAASPELYPTYPAWHEHPESGTQETCRPQRLRAPALNPGATLFGQPGAKKEGSSKRKGNPIARNRPESATKANPSSILVGETSRTSNQIMSTGQKPTQQPKIQEFHQIHGASNPLLLAPLRRFGVQNALSPLRPRDSPRHPARLASLTWESGQDRGQKNPNRIWPKDAVDPAKSVLNCLRVKKGCCSPSKKCFQLFAGETNGNMKGIQKVRV